MQGVDRGGQRVATGEALHQQRLTGAVAGDAVEPCDSEGLQRCGQHIASLLKSCADTLAERHHKSQSHPHVQALLGAPRAQVAVAMSDGGWQVSWAHIAADGQDIRRSRTGALDHERLPPLLGKLCAQSVGLLSLGAHLLLERADSGFCCCQLRTK